MQFSERCGLTARPGVRIRMQRKTRAVLLAAILSLWGADWSAFPATAAATDGAEAAELASPELQDPCLTTAIAATPSRPNWTAGAATTQCNVLEFDSGWLWMPVGQGGSQTLFPASVRYGLTPRMDLRWGLPGLILQNGAERQRIRGVTDQSFSVTYRFLEQRRRAPALAFGYGIKEPRANPAKGFGTGFVDHQMVFIVSRDLGRAHLDFNAVGTIAGGYGGKDGAVQAGLVASFPWTKTVTLLIEGEGGSQPGTEDRFGVALSGISFAIRPWLVADVAYTHTLMDGSPRAQMTAGITYAARSGLAPLSHNFRLARWLGR